MQSVVIVSPHRNTILYNHYLWTQLVILRCGVLDAGRKFAYVNQNSWCTCGSRRSGMMANASESNGGGGTDVFIPDGISAEALSEYLTSRPVWRIFLFYFLSRFFCCCAFPWVYTAFDKYHCSCPVWLQDEVLLIDARPYSDYLVGHIGGALSVRLSSLMTRRLCKGTNKL